jgi:hypothetical protein
MNGLSWLIYLADVAGSVGFVSGLAVVVGIIVVALCLVAIPVSEGEVLDQDNRSKWLSILKSFSIITFVAFLFSAIVPSKETVYAIAASEMGEQVVTSPTGQKAVKALEAWLDRQITPTDSPATE